jgi:hypothetical protein
VGVIGGAAITQLITSQAASMVSSISSGIPMYVAGALIAFLQGKLVGKLLKQPALGENMAVGGYTFVVLTMLHDMVSGFPNPFANLSGMGLITTSNNFGAPYANTPGSMTNFIRPAGIPAPMVAAAGSGKGMGRMSVRRMGRMAG